MYSQVTVGSATTSTPIPVDYLQTPFCVAFGITLGGGTMTFQVEHTLDNIFDPTITPTWFPHPTVQSATVDQDSSYVSPVRAVRLNVTAYTSGTATFKVLQGVE
jgi:hypothetical protein